MAAKKTKALGKGLKQVEAEQPSAADPCADCATVAELRAKVVELTAKLAIRGEYVEKLEAINDEIRIERDALRARPIGDPYAATHVTVSAEAGHVLALTQAIDAHKQAAWKVGGHRPADKQLYAVLERLR